MRKLSILMTASAFQALLISTPVWAQASFVDVAPPEAAQSVSAIGINNKGEVAGSYSTDGSDQLGFAGSIDGTYETFDVDGNQTQARGLNNQGRIVGYYVDTTNGLMEFEREKNGTITTITQDGAPLLGIAQGINSSGKFVGDYVGDPGSVPLRGAYKGDDGAFQEDVTLPFPALRVAGRAINSKGDIAGWFIPESGDSVQGFMIKSGEKTVLAHPDAVLTYIQGLNDKGEMSGSWQDVEGNFHGFALDSDMVTWTSFDVPDMSTTQGWQINNLGQIAVTSNDGTTGSSFIYCPKKTGVCSGNKGKAGKVKTDKGKANLNAPVAGNGRGPVDPETMGMKNGHQQ